VTRAWIVGLVAALLVAVALAVAALVLLSPGDDTLVLDLHSGDCFEVPDDVADATIAEVDTIDCTKPHEAEVFATGELNPDRDQPYPADEQQLFARVDRQCAAVIADRPELVERFGVLPVVADEQSWNSYRGRYVCVAIPYGGGTTEGSLGL
jgi:Septum formation